MNKILIFACFVNGLLLCTNLFSLLVWFGCVVCYQKYTHYFTRQHVLAFFVFFLLGQNTWVFFNQQIIETKENYAIASIDHRKVLIATDRPYFQGDKIESIGEMQDIRSNSNFNAFHFETMMKRKKITQMAKGDDTIIQPKNSIKRKIYERIQMFDLSTQLFLKRICYNFENEHHSLIYSSGLHYSLINQLILRLFSSSLIGNSIGILVMIGLGIAFPSHYALQRIIVFNCCRIVFRKMNRKDRLGISMLVCMMINSTCVFELGYILPILLQFVACFNCRKLPASFLSQLLLVFLNFYFFGEVNFIEILCFSFIRKLHTLGFIIGCLILAFPFLDFLSLIFSIFEFVSSFHFISYGKPPLWITICFIVCFLVFLTNGSKKMGVVCVVFLMLIPYQSYINPFVEVTFINVGQGDCILLRAPFNQGNVLIDVPITNIRNVSEDVVVPYLKSLGIQTIDTLILTHNDVDHAGGEEQLKQLIDVKETIRSHENVALGSLTLQSLNSIHEDENENSLVYALNVFGLSYLFMGDATKKVEKEILETYPTLHADILKVGHHGSKTSTDSLFIQQLKCRFAIISAGWHNFYGHPHSETLSTLKKYGVSQHVTFKDGACKIKSFLNVHFLYTSTGDFDIIIK